MTRDRHPRRKPVCLLHCCKPRPGQEPTGRLQSRGGRRGRGARAVPGAHGHCFPQRSDALRTELGHLQEPLHPFSPLTAARGRATPLRAAAGLNTAAVTALHTARRARGEQQPAENADKAVHTNGNTHRQHALKALRFEIREIPQHRSQPPAYRHLPDPSRSSPAALTAQIGSSGSGGQSRGPPGAADPSGGLRPGSPRRRPPLSRPPPPLPGGRHDEQPGRGPSLPSRPTPTWSASLSTAILLLRRRSSRAHAAPATGGARAPRPAPLLLLLRPQLRSAPRRRGGAAKAASPRLARRGPAQEAGAGEPPRTGRTAACRRLCSRRHPLPRRRGAGAAPRGCVRGRRRQSPP